MQPLTGLKVIDLTQVLSGPYCTMVLGDMGAEVIKVEKFPSGDDTRRIGGFEDNYNFNMVNRNKKGLQVNLTMEKGREIIYRLVEKADVFIENFRPGVAKKLGVDYETLKKHNSQLIYCSISGYGQTGPYCQKGGYDIMAQGMSGIMSMTGETDGRPVKVGIALHDTAAAVTALYHILLAYIYKLKSGEGQYIDISLVESGLAWTVWEAASLFSKGEIAEPNGTRHRMIAPYQGFRTKNGYILVGAANQKLWELFCKHVVEKEEWITDPRFITGNDRVQNVNELEHLIEDVFSEETSEIWLQKLESVGIPCGPIHTYAEALQNKQILSREMVIEGKHPRGGMMKMLGFPGKMSKTPAQLRSPAPLLGQHNDEILKELHYSEAEIRQLKEESII
ncbi:CaiB/BaiF CoA transferase family protein [Neobacillus citreus]|uniref:CoA transferase n=1 Tax=Neobacillus citreus TaxID=2833578 RepID=A0A942YCQ1_9BACI|nr:CoA transferase [Neobacillus citreus]MCH6264340.1 CoA transferase [Neobacillus citreus]